MPMTKGKRIKLRREELFMSQTDLAKRVNISKQTLYKYENDIITKIPSDKIEEISRVLGVSPSYIFGWNTDKEIIPDKLPADAKEFINLYEQADPALRQAALAVLKSAKHDS